MSDSEEMRRQLGIAPYVIANGGPYIHTQADTITETARQTELSGDSARIIRSSHPVARARGLSYSPSVDTHLPYSPVQLRMLSQHLVSDLSSSHGTGQRGSYHTSVDQSFSGPIERQYEFSAYNSLGFRNTDASCPEINSYETLDHPSDRRIAESHEPLFYDPSDTPYGYPHVQHSHDSLGPRYDPSHGLGLPWPGVLPDSASSTEPCTPTSDFIGTANMEVGANVNADKITGHHENENESRPGLSDAQSEVAVTEGSSKTIKRTFSRSPSPSIPISWLGNTDVCDLDKSHEALRIETPKVTRKRKWIPSSPGSEGEIVTQSVSSLPETAAVYKRTYKVHKGEEDWPGRDAKRPKLSWQSTIMVPEMGRPISKGTECPSCGQPLERKRHSSLPLHL